MAPESGTEGLRARANGRPHPLGPEGGDVTAAAQHKEFKSPLDKKYHQDRSALLGPGKGLSLTGFMNLLFCLTTLAAVGLLLENINKYGLRVHVAQWVHAFDARNGSPGFYPAAYLLLYMPVQIFVALGIEKVIAAGRVPEADGVKAHLVNLLWHVSYPVVGIWLAGDAISILAGVIVCQLNAIVFLKMWSFVQACCWARERCRHLQQHPQQPNHHRNHHHHNHHHNNHHNNHHNGNGAAAEAAPGPTPAPPTEYPDNLTVGNLAYFTFAPTLCYEMDYPRNPAINWRRVALRGTLLLAVFVLHMCVVQQVLVPSYRAVLGPLARGEWSVLAERLCKIAIPNNLVWLVFFYQMFHVNMILVSELTRFADRRSYESWWDSEDLNVFWRRWNLPVHHWCVRHLYLPLLRRGYSKTAAKWATFVFSGVFHEYLVSPPLRVFRLYAFAGMLAQVPLGDLSEWVCRRLGPRWGNAVVWFSLCVGQPLSVVLYSRDYALAHGGPAGLAAYARIDLPAMSP